MSNNFYYGWELTLCWPALFNLFNITPYRAHFVNYIWLLQKYNGYLILSCKDTR